MDGRDSRMKRKERKESKRVEDDPSSMSRLHERGALVNGVGLLADLTPNRQGRTEANLQISGRSASARAIESRDCKTTATVTFTYTTT